jgi:putative transposase
MLRAYKYRIYPKTDQAKMIDQNMAACRLVYNLGLEIRIWAYRGGQRISNYDLHKQIKDLRAAYPWIAEVSSQPLYTALNNLDTSFRRFYSGAGFPRFKSRKRDNSYSCHNGLRKIDWENGTLTIPKMPSIPIALSRKFEGQIKTITIRKTPTGKYFASILVDNKLEVPIKGSLVPEPDKTIGVDVGVKSFVVCSDGREFRPNQFLKKSLDRLRILQRRASRKKKGSANRKKANLRASLLYEKISNQRSDYIHKITTSLVCDNQADCFVIEDLSAINLMKNRQLSRAIADASFGEFFSQMQYKCKWRGKHLIVIDRFAPSSKRCSNCGSINNELTLANREWTCKCGASHDRDHNAAKNIKYFGLEKHSGRGTSGEPVEPLALAAAKKQELKKCQPVVAGFHHQLLSIKTTQP